MNLLPINANWFCRSTLTTPSSAQLWDTHCNFTGHLISYLLHNKSIVISKKGGGGGGLLAASSLVSCLHPSFLFIFIYWAAEVRVCFSLYWAEVCVCVEVRAEIVWGGVCRVTSLPSAFMWTCWICSWLTYQPALFSSLKEPLNIQRLHLSAAATDSSEPRICVFTSHRCVTAGRTSPQLLFGAWAAPLSDGRACE